MKSRALLLALLMLAAYPAPSKPLAAAAVPVYFWERLTIANNSSSPYPLGLVLLPLPLNDSYQYSRLLNFSIRAGGAEVKSCSVRVVEEECGSSFLAVRCPDPVPPLATLSIEVVARVAVTRFKPPSLNYSSSGFRGDVPPQLREYTKPEGPWRYDEGGMRYLAEKARELVSGEDRVLPIVARLVNWIWSKVDYDIGVGPRYPNETLPPTAVEEEGRGRGDCDDQANLLILMLRSLGVPAYLKIALVADFNYGAERQLWEPDMHYYINFLGINWGHAWAEVYVPPWGWLPVDLTFHLASSDPLESIKSSAASEYWARYTIVTIRMRNVCHSDYIAEFRREVREAAASPLFYYWEYAVVREGDSIARVKRFLRQLPLPWMKETEIEVEHPSKVTVFESFEVRGLLKPSVAHAQLLIEVVSPSGERHVERVETGPGGSWSMYLKLNETGLWNFNVTYAGSRDYLPSSKSFSILVEKIGTTLALRAVSREGLILIWGKLSPPIGNSTISVVVRAPNGTLIRREVAVEGGLFNMTLRTGVPGEYVVEASWLGDEYHKHVVNSTKVLVKLPTTITARVMGEAREDRPLLIEGHLEPSLDNVTVDVEAEAQDGRRKTLAVRTGSGGFFQAKLRLGAGRWCIRVVFRGTEYYLPSSVVLTVEVRREADHILALSLLAILAVAAVIITGRRLRRRRALERPIKT